MPEEEMTREMIETIRKLAESHDFGGVPIPQLCDLAIKGLSEAAITQDEWYEREKAAFIAWWESGGQKKFSETPGVRLTDEQIMAAACTAADALDATRVSEMRADGWHATTIFYGDSGLLRFGRLIEQALSSESRPSHGGRPMTLRECAEAEELSTDKLDQLAAMGDSPCWPLSHDANCESVAVDIGVGEMHSPCGCEVRWYQRALRAVQSANTPSTVLGILERMGREGEHPLAILRAVREWCEHERSRYVKQSP